MAGISRLKHMMFSTMAMTLAVFVILVATISLLFHFSFLVSIAPEISPTYTLVVAFGLASLFMLIQYVSSPRIVAASMRLIYPKPGKFPQLVTTVKELASKSNVPMPRIAIVPLQDPNACVFGNSTSRMTLVLHEGLLKQLTEDELRGVIGHELGHIRNKDSIVMTVLSTIPLIAYMIAKSALGFGVIERRGYRRGGAAVMPLVGVVALVFYSVAQLLVLRLSRLREHFSDAHSAYVTGSPKSLESALIKIVYGLSYHPGEPHGARALLISDPAQVKREMALIAEKREDYDLDRDGVLDEYELKLAMEKEAKSLWVRVNTLFSTHPPTYKRILHLREIGEEMRAGTYTTTDIYKNI